MTGVQTCALPISDHILFESENISVTGLVYACRAIDLGFRKPPLSLRLRRLEQIDRATEFLAPGRVNFIVWAGTANGDSVLQRRPRYVWVRQMVELQPYA